MDYELELGQIADKIKKSRCSYVCIQLPDGLKPRAEELQRELKGKTNARLSFWAGSCFGACDVPLHIGKLGIGLLIQFGHSEWK
ncbi:hypothetical protein KY320_02930 [Candidatus Woesearchaeota archaeon]|nr:hypothetical protein [Candidatus Woesearchaeota archaeon]